MAFSLYAVAYSVFGELNAIVKIIDDRKRNLLLNFTQLITPPPPVSTFSNNHITIPKIPRTAKTPFRPLSQEFINRIQMLCIMLERCHRTVWTWILKHNTSVQGIVMLSSVLCELVNCFLDKFLAIRVNHHQQTLSITSEKIFLWYYRTACVK